MKEIERSLEAIDDEDLAKLAAVAVKDRVAFRFQCPRYNDAKVLCVALCQGAALHYISGDNGVNDFDLWTFYERTDGMPDFPPRRSTHYDFGESKFGRHPVDQGYLGRRIDVFGRSIGGPAGGPVELLREYLSSGRTKSARCLAKEAVVLLEPAHLRGAVVWPLGQVSNKGILD